jgi:hypothetical protein
MNTLRTAYYTFTTSIGWMNETVITAALPAIPTCWKRLGGRAAEVAMGDCCLVLMIDLRMIRWMSSVDKINMRVKRLVFVWLRSALECKVCSIAAFSPLDDVVSLTTILLTNYTLSADIIYLIALQIR